MFEIILFALGDFVSESDSLEELSSSKKSRTVVDLPLSSAYPKLLLVLRSFLEDSVNRGPYSVDSTLRLFFLPFDLISTIDPFLFEPIWLSYLGFYFFSEFSFAFYFLKVSL